LADDHEDGFLTVVEGQPRRVDRRGGLVRLGGADQEVGLEVIEERALDGDGGIGVGTAERSGDGGLRVQREVIAALVHADAAGEVAADIVELEVQVDADVLQEVTADGKEPGLDRDLHTARLAELGEDVADDLVILGRLDDDQHAGARALGDGAAGIGIELLPGILGHGVHDHFHDRLEVFLALLFIVIVIPAAAAVIAEQAAAVLTTEAAEAATATEAATAAEAAGAAAGCLAAAGEHIRVNAIDALGGQQQVVDVIGTGDEHGVARQVIGRRDGDD